MGEPELMDDLDVIRGPGQHLPVVSATNLLVASWRPAYCWHRDPPCGLAARQGCLATVLDVGCGRTPPGRRAGLTGNGRCRSRASTLTSGHPVGRGHDRGAGIATERRRAGALVDAGATTWRSPDAAPPYARGGRCSRLEVLAAVAAQTNWRPAAPAWLVYWAANTAPAAPHLRALERAALDRRPRRAGRALPRLVGRG
ncbi:hypothetical protein QJS66_21535 [Kocuria rhizophila]|nr:hypothetical protein QJS66_21535 [Kocuria rhizophila]